MISNKIAEHPFYLFGSSRHNWYLEITPKDKTSKREWNIWTVTEYEIMLANIDCLDTPLLSTPNPYFSSSQLEYFVHNLAD